MKHNYTTSRLLLYQRNCFAALCLLLSVSSYAQVGEVIWEENFNALDADVWNIDVGDGCDQGICGWGNQELQWYSEDNVSIAPIPGESGNNALVLEARNQASNGKGFTSGKIQSNGNLAVQYGLIEVRMRVPDLQTGLWPAAWLLGTSTIGWPGKGEIDMMEMGHAQAERARQGYPDANVNSYVGSNLIFAADAACSDANLNCAASTAYDVDYNKPYVATTPLSDRFVIYRLYWTSENIRFTILDNGTEYDLYEAPFVIGEESTEFQQPFYLLLNLAVGGTFTDAATDPQVTAPLPAKMYVDYVRVSEYNGEGEVFYGNVNPPETGTFGIFTDETLVTNTLQAGVSSDIYAWGNLVAGTTEPYEGSEVIAWQFNAPNSWFGGGIVSRQARDMSNFEEGNLKFAIKIPADVSFRIGITDTYTNESYVEFPANQTKYGLVRNGEWGEVTIPISELRGDLIALQSMQYLFAIASVDGAFPTSNFQMGIDNIYWEGGGDTDPVLASIEVSPGSATLSVSDTQQFSAQAFDRDGNSMDANLSWAATGGTISNSGLFTGTAPGNVTVTASAGNVSGTATVTVSETNQGVSIPARLEAEDYSEMSGVQLEATSDTDGDQNVGWIEVGDWLEYELYVPTTSDYTVSYRVASATSGGAITLTEDGVNRATTSFDATGGWQSWTTVNETVRLTAGAHTIRLTASTGGWNINWLQFEQAVPAFSQTIEAEDYAVAAGVQTEPCSEGGSNVGYIDSGDWMVWDVNIPDGGSYQVEYRVASPNDNGALQLEQAGGSLTYGDPVRIPNTGGWQNWTTVSQAVELSAGQQQIAISVPEGGWNINWLTVSRLQEASAAVRTSTDRKSNSMSEKVVTIYPNPVTNELTVAGVSSEAIVSLYDLAGHLLQKNQVSQGVRRLDVHTLKPGVYLLRVQGEKVRTLKFVKE